MNEKIKSLTAKIQIKALEDVIIAQRSKCDLYSAVGQAEDAKANIMIIEVLNATISRLEKGLDPIPR